MPVNPIWITPIVENSVDARFAFLYFIVDGIRESAGEGAEETKSARMYSSIKCERLDFAVKRVHEIVAESFTLTLIEPVAVYEIVMGRCKKPNTH